ncbi:hypothetical protein ACFT8P_31005 [Streptomyces sp. NPDC057101]|uniref:hypothetical protein n=1 Tax=Streptomyces sp. NPDC057101 TaxID=3346020 RepID=UPI0036267FE3
MPGGRPRPARRAVVLDRGAQLGERGGRVVGRGDPAEQRAGVGPYAEGGAVLRARCGDLDQPGEFRPQGRGLGHRVGGGVEECGAGPAVQQAQRRRLRGAGLPEGVEDGGPLAQFPDLGHHRRTGARAGAVVVARVESVAGVVAGVGTVAEAREERPSP